MRLPARVLVQGEQQRVRLPGLPLAWLLLEVRGARGSRHKAAVPCMRASCKHGPCCAAQRSTPCTELEAEGCDEWSWRPE